MHNFIPINLAISIKSTKSLGNNLPELHQDERENSNNIVSSTEIEFIIKHLRNKREINNFMSRSF